MTVLPAVFELLFLDVIEELVDFITSCRIANISEMVPSHCSVGHKKDKVFFLNFKELERCRVGFASGGRSASPKPEVECRIANISEMVPSHCSVGHKKTRPSSWILRSWSDVELGLHQVVDQHLQSQKKLKPTPYICGSIHA